MAERMRELVDILNHAIYAYYNRSIQGTGKASY